MICAFPSQYDEAFNLIHEKLVQMKKTLTDKASYDPLNIPPRAETWACTAIVDHRFTENPFANMKMQRDAMTTESENQRECKAAKGTLVLSTIPSVAATAIMTTVPSDLAEARQKTPLPSIAANETAERSASHLEITPDITHQPAEASKSQTRGRSPSTADMEKSMEAWKGRTILSFGTS